MILRLPVVVAASLFVCLWQPFGHAAIPIPAGLQPGDTYHLLFNSSTMTNSFSSDIGFYNDFVQSAADAAGIGSSEGVTWNALASTASIDARLNAFVGTNTPVYNTRGAGMQKIADGFDDLWDGSIDSFPAYTERGFVNANDPWTGSTSAGLRATGSTLGHPSGTAWCGRPSQTDSRWFQILEVDTFFFLPVYALSEELTVPDADFDSDGDVDGHDFLRWQRGAGDANGDGETDAADLAFWRNQYGRGTTSIADNASASLAVPEPSSALLFAIASTLVLSKRSARRSTLPLKTNKPL